MFRTSALGVMLGACALLTGCASIVSGQNQSVSVVTKQVESKADVAGAKCSLTNDKGTWYVTTPGSVTVRRSYNELAVNCALEGFDNGVSIAKSSTKGMAFGNILFGGVIGAGVDMSTGAAYDYPDVISVEMLKPGTAKAAPAPLAPQAQSTTVKSVVLKSEGVQVAKDEPAKQ